MSDVRYVIDGCDNSHDWRLPFGVEYFTVNGERRSNPKICRNCLVGENSVGAESPCDRAASGVAVSPDGGE